MSQVSTTDVQPGESPASLEARLARLEAVVERQRETIAQQHTQLQALQARRDTEREADPASMVTVVPAQRPARTSRRRLLTTAGAAAAAVVLAGETSCGTAHGAPTHADTVTFQQSASGIDNVAIEGDGTSGALGVMGTADSGAGVVALSSSGNGVYGSTNTGFAGVYGFSEFGTAGVFGQSDSGYGVYGLTNSTYGVYGQSTNNDGVHGFSANLSGVAGVSTNSVGGYFAGGRAPLNLQPAGAPGAPTTGAHSPGDLWLDSAATLWLCVGSGTPGSWVRVARVANGTTGGTVNYLAAPVRLLDARSGASSGLVNRGPLTAGEIYALSVAGLGGSGIPAGALGLICNVTVLGPSANGNLSLFPAGATVPTTASMTFVAGAFLANHVNAALGGGKVNIQNQSAGSTPLVLDAVGFIL